MIAPSRLRRQDINLSALGTHWHSMAHNLRGDDDRFCAHEPRHALSACGRVLALYTPAQSTYINIFESSYCPPTASRLVALLFPFLALMVLKPYNIRYGACFERRYSPSNLDHGQPIQSAAPSSAPPARLREEIVQFHPSPFDMSTALEMRSDWRGC